MKRSLHLQFWVLGISFTLLLGISCKEKSETTPEQKSPTPTEQQQQQPEQTQEPAPQQFAITYPTENSAVDGDIITVRGTGAQPGTTVEIDVFTDTWYPQNGAAEVNADGTWTYSPCYLKGQGSFKRHHNIRAKLMRGGEQIAVVTIYDVAVE